MEKLAKLQDETNKQYALRSLLWILDCPVGETRLLQLADGVFEFRRVK